MTDEIVKNKDSGSNLFLFTVIGILIPIFYILSVGPVAWLFQTMGWQKSSLEIFYMPVIWLHDHTFLEEPLEWYLLLFGLR